MTTIFYHDGTLMADSYCTDPDAPIWKMEINKIFEVEDGYIAGAGDFAELEEIIQQIKEKGLDCKIEVPKNDSSWELVFMHKTDPKKDFALYVSDFGRIMKMQIKPGDHYALGSGASYALGAFYTGNDILLAMQAAANYDPYTGGAIWEARRVSDGVKVSPGS